MAEKRMFAKSIVLSDAFLDMPMSARCLYFTLNMFADDDGFVGSPKGIMRQCGASEDDMRILLAKRYVLDFESGVIVIKHWRINNYLRNDRYKETTYIDEKSQLYFDEKGAYTDRETDRPVVGIPDGIPSIDKYSIDKSSIEDKGLVSPTSDQMQLIIDTWNSQGCTHPIKNIPFGNYRYTHTLMCIDNDLDSFLDTIKKIDEQEWFKKQKQENRPLKYDWFVDPNNYIKVVEGNYRYLGTESHKETETERKLRMLEEM